MNTSVAAHNYGAQLVPPNFSHQVSFTRRQFSLARLFFFGTTLFFRHDFFFFRHDSLFLARLFFTARLFFGTTFFLLIYYFSLSGSFLASRGVILACQRTQRLFISLLMISCGTSSNFETLTLLKRKKIQIPP